MRIAIYTRISEDDEELGKGVARQLKDCKDLIARLGWDGEVVVFEENDTSATRTKFRPLFDQMMGEARAGRIDSIVFWDSDRITRSPREAEDVIDLVTVRGVKVIGFHGDDLTSSDGQMMFRIKITVARNEIDKMRRRIRSASDQRAAEGRMAGRTGYGFTRTAKSGPVVLVPEEVAVIQEAVRRILQGDSLRRVCLDFQARGVPTPGRGAEWTTTTLRQLVLRESLAGLRRHRGAVVGELHTEIPRILTVEQHERLKAMLNDPVRRTAPIGRAPKYLLGGIARCGKPTGEDADGNPETCGGAMVRAVGRITTTKTGGTKRQPPSYVCSVCFGVRRKQADVDGFVEDVLLGRLELPEAFGLFARGDEAAAVEAREALARVDARLANAADAFAAGDIDREQLVRITAKLRAERDRHQEVVRAAVPAAIDPDLIGEHARATWAGMSVERRRKLVGMLLDVVICPSGAGRDFDPSLVQIRWRAE